MKRVDSSPVWKQFRSTSAHAVLAHDFVHVDTFSLNMTPGAASGWITREHRPVSPERTIRQSASVSAGS
jgi:hypothetical protein